MSCNLNLKFCQVSELEKLMLAKNVEIASGVQLLRERDEELSKMRGEVEEMTAKMEESERRAEEIRGRLEEALSQSEVGEKEKRIEEMQEGDANHMLVVDPFIIHVRLVHILQSSLISEGMLRLRMNCQSSRHLI